jgi:hypothetical protein
LISSKAVPAYDTTKTVSGSKITSDYSAWTSASKDLYDVGLWQKAMGAAGGRDDIAPNAGWHTRWLYTGDYRHREVALGQSDLASGFPAIIRETVNTKTMASGVNGLGYPASIYGRPTTSFGSGYDYGSTVTGDKVKVLVALASSGWQVDPPHMYDPWTLSYQLTGDYYYLESALMWSAWMAHFANGAAAGAASYGRGPTGKEAVIDNYQMRGIGWTFRTWAETEAMTPDASPWKAILAQYLADAIAADEGARNITTSAYNGNAVWTFGSTLRSTNSQETLGGAYPTLGQWRRGSVSFSQPGYGIDSAVTLEGIGLFEQSILTYALGRAKELGHATDKLLTYVAPMYVGILTNAGFNKYMLGGRMPTVAVSGTAYFTTWAGLKSGFHTDVTACQAVGGCDFVGGFVVQNSSSYALNGPEGGYEFMGQAATSMIYGESGGPAAWTALESTGTVAASATNDVPNWAIIPRDYTPATSNGGSRFSGRVAGRVQ